MSNKLDSVKSKELKPFGAENIDYDTRYSRNACVWFSSTADIANWSEYYLDNLYYSMIPTSDSSESVP